MNVNLFPVFLKIFDVEIDRSHHLSFSYLLLPRIYAKLTLLEKVRSRQLV